MSDEFREFLLETLPKSAHKKIDEIVAEHELYLVDIEAVHVGQRPPRVRGDGDPVRAGDRTRRDRQRHQDSLPGRSVYGMKVLVGRDLRMTVPARDDRMKLLFLHRACGAILRSAVLVRHCPECDPECHESDHEDIVQLLTETQGTTT